MDLSNPKITPALTMTRSDLATQVATCPTAYPAGATRELPTPPTARSSRPSLKPERQPIRNSSSGGTTSPPTPPTY